MFANIHSAQKEGWHSVREVIVTHTNSFSEQQEQEGMISLSNRIIVTSLLCQPKAEDLTRDIIKKKKTKLKTTTAHF